MCDLITINDFEKVVDIFGFGHPVTTLIWNTVSMFAECDTYWADLYELMKARYTN